MQATKEAQGSRKRNNNKMEMQKLITMSIRTNTITILTVYDLKACYGVLFELLYQFCFWLHLLTILAGTLNIWFYLIEYDALLLYNEARDLLLAWVKYAQLSNA